MYEVLEQSHDQVVGLRVREKLTDRDYQSLVPYLEEAIQRHGKLRLYWEMVDFKGWKPAALWQDVKFDVRHGGDFERIAMVGEKRWQEWVSQLIKPFTGAEVKYFDHSKRDEAWSWTEGADSDSAARRAPN